MTIKCLIVDDEQDACTALESLLTKYVGGIEVVGVANSVDEAVEQITRHQPDLVMLDIEMPNGNGFTLFDRIKEINFEVIFATAYDQYAIKAIKYSAMDYLLKPFDLRELKQAIAKVDQRMARKINNNRIELLLENLRSPGTNEKIALANHDGFVYVNLNQIVRITADGNYSDIYMADGIKHVVSKALGEIEDLFPKRNFFRIHRSYLVNTNYIKRYIKSEGQQVVMEDGSILDVSHRKKEEFLKFMKQLK